MDLVRLGFCREEEDENEDEDDWVGTRRGVGLGVQSRYVVTNTVLPRDFYRQPVTKAVTNRNEAEQGS